MNLDTKFVIWLCFSLSAVVILARMMDKRRAKLGQLLQTHVQARVQWNKKRANASRLTEEMARRKLAEETGEAQAMQPAHSSATRSPQVASPLRSGPKAQQIV